VHTNDPSATPTLDHSLRCSVQAEEHPVRIGVEDPIEIGSEAGGGYLGL
jgi:hypothetical protein